MNNEFNFWNDEKNNNNQKVSQYGIIFLVGKVTTLMLIRIRKFALINKKIKKVQIYLAIIYLMKLILGIIYVIEKITRILKVGIIIKIFGMIKTWIIPITIKIVEMEIIME